MDERKTNIVDEYSHEIDEIRYILNNLERGRIYERTGWSQDRYLATNIQKLRKEIVNLLVKIQDWEPGDKKRIKEVVNLITVLEKEGMTAEKIIEIIKYIETADPKDQSNN